MIDDFNESMNDIDAQIDYIKQARSLRDINDFLTARMAKQKIQALIKEDNLKLICNSIIDLAIKKDNSSEGESLIVAAMLGRLSAVARGRESVVFSRVSELFKDKPHSIDSLADGDEKYYATLTLSHVNSEWLVEYCFEQAVALDTAEKARRLLLTVALNKNKTLTSFWKSNHSKFKKLKSIESDEARFKRVRRISAATNEIIRNWEGEVGEDPGNALAEWFESLVGSSKKDTEKETLAVILDDVLSMLLRIIELRFSNALLAPTYALIDTARTSFGEATWSQVIAHSKNIEKVRTCTKEAALVLARQGRTDKDVMHVLCNAFYSRSQVMSAIKAYFSLAKELDPDVKDWWEKAGKVKESHRKVEHKLRNSEDQQIGSLLINVQESKTVMEKLERAVVPFLEISDPPLAETVKKAAGSYSEIAIATRQLAAMRKLKHMDLKGAVLEYNPIQHEMLGGHQLGIRSVKVQRDGIQKSFAGKIKILVKPRVTPEE